MRGIKVWTVCVLFIAACGGSPTPAETPEEPIAETEPAPEPAPAPEPEAEGEGEEAPKEEAPAADPEFKDGMTVDEAIAVVPQGTSRVNVDQETLSQPLVDPKLYEPCKLKPNQHFKLKVAVWDGRAVGIDVDTQPKNDKVADCVKEQVRAVEWKDKVKSLNTVEYAL